MHLRTLTHEEAEYLAAGPQESSLSNTAEIEDLQATIPDDHCREYYHGMVRGLQLSEVVWRLMSEEEPEMFPFILGLLIARSANLFLDSSESYL